MSIYKGPRKRITIRIPIDMFNRVKQVSDLSFSDTVFEALGYYLIVHAQKDNK